MPGNGLFSLLFVLYCLEAGAFLTIAPWTAIWDRTAVQVPALGVASLLLDPVVRGGVTGLGLVHLLWAAHDVEMWLHRRRAP